MLDQGSACVRAFFPLAGLVSLTQERREGALVHLALVGAEGMLGLPLLTGDDGRPMGATVQCAGYGLALGRDCLIDEWEAGGAFREVLLRYSQVLDAEIELQAQCRSDHMTVQRLGTLVLMIQHRLAGQDCALTIEHAARLLGVSPEVATQAGRSLGEDGALTICPDGAMAVADQAALQAKACNCHNRIREQQKCLMEAARDAAEPMTPGQSRISASISSHLTGTPREINSQPLSVTIASSSMRIPML